VMMIDQTVRGRVFSRRATLDDASCIASLLFDAFVEFRAAYTEEAFAATAVTSEQMTQRLREGPVWVACADARLLGTVSAVDRAEDLYVRGMAVLPAARGRAVGRSLMAEVETFARRHGYRRLLLSTTPFLTHAIHLYEHAGFHRVDEGPDHLCGTPLWTMAKVLAP
jgi:putative acetyltransferase